jgi:hypothetical protein
LTETLTVGHETVLEHVGTVRHVSMNAVTSLLLTTTEEEAEAVEMQLSRVLRQLQMPFEEVSPLTQVERDWMQAPAPVAAGQLELEPPQIRQKLERSMVAMGALLPKTEVAKERQLEVTQEVYGATQVQTEAVLDVEQEE